MIKVLSLFSGIGAFEKALTNLNIKHEVVNYCEIDKYASKAYSSIHNVSEDKNLGDISKINEKELKDFDLMTYGFPCQDISVAGKQKGINKDTRSGLLYEALRIAKYKKPKYLIAENVKNLVGKKFKKDFEKLLEELIEMGYNNYWKVLNAKDYGIPQNRERVFIISIRKDIDKGYDFPKPHENGLILKDMLDDEVEEKYYINKDKVEKLISRLKDNKKGSLPKLEEEPKMTSALGSREHRASGWKEESGTLCARDYKDPKVVAVKVKEATKKGYDIATEEDSINISFPNSKTRRGRVGKGVAQTLETSCTQAVLTPNRINKRQNGRRFKEDGEPMFTLTSQDRHGILQVGNIVETGNFKNPQRGRIYSKEGISPALNTVGGGGLEPKIVCEQRIDEGLRFFKNECVGTIRTIDAGRDKRVVQGYTIRKLTPLECWRLMGFDDEDYWKARKGLEKTFYKDKDRSNSQMYKMAGNSIVVNVLEEILKELF